MRRKYKTGIEPASSNNRLDILSLNYSIILTAPYKLHIYVQGMDEESELKLELKILIFLIK
jgi:hypothetical protein